MENWEQLNNNEQDVGLNGGNMGEETWAIHQNWMNVEEYDMDALLGPEDHENTEQDEDEEANQPKVGEPSKRRKKRFTVEQFQQLESSFQESTHPDDDMRKQLAEKTGLEPRQVKFWFQNRRSQRKVKAVGEENKEIQEQNNKLLADNMEMQQHLLGVTCSRCRDPTDEKLQRLLEENAKLHGMYLCAQENFIKMVHDANLPRSMTMEYLESASLNLMPITYNGSTDRDKLFSYSKRALEEFLMLAARDEPMWLPTSHGNMLNDLEYKRQTVPGLLGPSPLGFVMEGSKETAVVRATTSSLVALLSNVNHWSKIFPGIVEGVRDSKVLFRGNSTSPDRLIQEISVDLWVQSPVPPIRSMKLLRISKHVGDRMWAVVDVSIDGTRGIFPEGRRIGYTTCRLLPSGCLIQDIGNGYSKVTWIVHAEYDGTIVPPLFRKLFQSGQALGATRWLATLQRRCEYLAMLRIFGHVPVPSSISSSEVAMSAPGRKSVLALARQMTASFYAAVSKSATLKPDNIVSEWSGRCGTAAEMFDAKVHMVIRNCSPMGEPPALVLTATTTVWLQNTPPQLVLEYLCNGDRRGEWDTFAYARAVQELSSITTCPIRGNAVSILYPSNPADQNKTNMMLLQETASDISCSLVVYSFVEKNMMRAVMDGVNNNPVFLLPSGFAILPDGHGEADLFAAAASSSSSAPTGNNHTAGSLLTASYQAMLPSSASNSIHAAGTFNETGNRVCHAINHILAAVGAYIAKPA